MIKCIRGLERSSESSSKKRFKRSKTSMGLNLTFVDPVAVIATLKTIRRVIKMKTNLILKESLPRSKSRMV